MFITQQQRRDTAANWTATNSVLFPGEFGYETDTTKMKIGDGVTSWNALAYWSAGTGSFTSPMTTLGDTMFENSTTAARLPGNTSATNKFLTQQGNGSVSAPPGWNPIQAADVPPLPDYAPTGLTGAVAASRYVGATISGAPLSGTFAVGDFIVAQDGPIWLCVTAGSPGKWKVAGDQPWQFRPETYGAKGDGKIISDGYMGNGSAVLTTQGLQAPAAPGLAHGGSGNTVPAGVYLVKVTYVNAYGETLASAQSSVTVGAAENLVISSPADAWLANASGWYAYVTQAAGSTYFRQQSPGSPTAIGTSLTITANPTTTGLNPPGANTSATNPFASTDVGKSVLIWVNASGIWLLTTIASFQNPGQVTLNATAPAAITQGGFVFGTDDTPAIQSAVNAAFAYAQQPGTQQPGSGLAEILFRQAIYCNASAPVKNAVTLSNSQVYLPYVNALSSRGLEIKLTGAGTRKRPHWWQPEPAQGGTILLGMRLDGAFDNTYGSTSVIGGPYAGMGGDLGTFSNVNVTVSGITVMTPPWNNGTPYSGMQFLGMSTARVPEYSYLPLAPWLTTLYTSSVWPYIKNISNPPSYGHFGLMMPAIGNNALNEIGMYLGVWGQYGLVGAEHMSISDLCLSYFASGWVPAQAGHGAACLQYSCENTPFPIDTVGGSFPFGAAGAHLTVGMLSLETYTLVYRTRGAGGPTLQGQIFFEDQNTAAGHYFSGGLTDTTTAPYMKMIFAQGGAGPLTPQSVPASTVAFGNYYYHDATVYITSGGAAVTVISVDGTPTGLTLGASGTVAVRVPSGHNITLTYASTAPTWTWFAD